MKHSVLKLLAPALLGGWCLLVAPPGVAATFNLRAVSFNKNVEGRPVLMWGFVLGNTPTSPGPVLTVPANDSQVVINLKNDLSVPISLVIPNQNGFVRDASHSSFTDAEGRARARSFVKETPPGQTVQYVWNNVSPGTYIYYSGSHPALHVQMGLYGMLKKNFSDEPPQRQVYEGVFFRPSAERIVMLGEIDFEVHDAVRDGTYGTAVKSMIHSVPDVYLYNGTPYKVGYIPAATENVALLRLLNACYDERVPVVSGLHVRLVAEDGRKYAHSRLENAINLPSLKTRDALVETILGNAPPAPFTFYDRRALSRP